MRFPFGAGKAPDNAGVTNPNMVMGTPDYLSPEQAAEFARRGRAERHLFARLHAVLPADRASRRSSARPRLLISCSRTRTMSRRRSMKRGPTVPEGLAEVLATMMAKNPDDRYQKASTHAAGAVVVHASERVGTGVRDRRRGGG